MLKFLPFVLAIVYGFAVYRFSAWRTAKELNSRSTLLFDPGIRQHVDRMAEALEIDDIKVHLYEVDMVNGLAAPDGRIFLTRGFYRKYSRGEVSSAEIAGVIAHELGHVALGHSRRRMIDFSGQNAMRAALVMVLGRVLPGIGAILANAVTSLVAAGLSRRDEYEADAYAAALLTKSGIGTEPQKTLFGKLESLTSGGGGGMPAWMMSHPKTADRIAEIERLEARWQVSGDQA